MRPRFSAAVAVALCCVLAGCAGGGTATAPTETTPAATPEQPDGSVVAYSSLSAMERTAFDLATTDGSAVFGPESPALDTDARLSATTPFREHGYVERNGTYYEVTLRDRGSAASYSIRTEVVAASDSGAAVAFEDVTGDHTDYLRRALENGSYYVPPGPVAGLDLSVDSGDRVEYRDATYRVRVVTGDSRLWELTVDGYD